ncbi:auxin-induced protein 22D-like [Typha angustifolia]|uniref:auxin-induced protein 22D-like n=1 Tax=Typha angustifolia TaxID=59011 RepID=UPI003C2D223E
MEGEASYIGDQENFKATELTLGLPGTNELDRTTHAHHKGGKGVNKEFCTKRTSSETENIDQDAAPAAKAQVVGWPPIQSYRKKNTFRVAKMGMEEAARLVKVSMDGAPYLRKIDLNLYKEYKELEQALEEMFKCFSPGIDGCNTGEYAMTYEDKDGDLMLVGDVPWEMFISSCKKLRIMRSSQVRGAWEAHDKKN